MRCKWICITSNRQCASESSIDGYCIRHWWKIVDKNEEDMVEMPL